MTEQQLIWKCSVCGQDVEDQQGPIREQREVAPCRPLKRHRSRLDVAGIGEGHERGGLVGQPFHRGIRGAEGHGNSEKGDAGGTAVPRGEREDEQRRGKPRQDEGAEAAWTAQGAARAEGDRQCEQRAGHGPPL